MEQDADMWHAAAVAAAQEESPNQEWLNWLIGTAAEAKAGVQLGVGQIDDSDITYVNGQQVGQTEKQWNLPRVYAVPAAALRAGVNQIAVNPAIGLSFAAVLRSVLRHDPDIIVVGELRDGETAEIAVNAALTGHLVLATVHTNTAAGAAPRLIDMGVDPALLRREGGENAGVRGGVRHGDPLRW